jgi:hypothetical protein
LYARHFGNIDAESDDQAPSKLPPQRSAIATVPL